MLEKENFNPRECLRRGKLNRGKQRILEISMDYKVRACMDLLDN
jgi:hypothetical protein